MTLTSWFSPHLSGYFSIFFAGSLSSTWTQNIKNSLRFGSMLLIILHFWSYPRPWLQLPPSYKWNLSLYISLYHSSEIQTYISTGLLGIFTGMTRRYYTSLTCPKQKSSLSSLPPVSLVLPYTKWIPPFPINHNSDFLFLTTIKPITKLYWLYLLNTSPL